MPTLMVHRTTVLMAGISRKGKPLAKVGSGRNITGSMSQGPIYLGVAGDPLSNVILIEKI